MSEIIVMDKAGLKLSIFCRYNVQRLIKDMVIQFSVCRLSIFFREIPEPRFIQQMINVRFK